jgi:hypothetical protein
MEETERLKKEIERLNKIINILIDQIGMLKSENEGFRQIIKKNGLETAIGIPDNGQKEKITSVARSDNGQQEKNISVVLSDNGQQQTNISVARSDNGLNENITTVVQSENSRNELKTTVAQTVTTYIESNHANKLKLAGQLKTYFTKNIKHRSLEGLAAELLLLHNNGHASYRELRQQSGLSVSGFSKHGRLLQSQGLIKRESFHKYVLTPQFKDIVIKTFQT